MSKKSGSRSRAVSAKSTSASANVLSTMPRAGFRRRLGAWVIDSLLVTPLVVLAGYVGYGLGHLLVISGLLSLDKNVTTIGWLVHQLWFSLWLAGVLCSYFVWFWCREGQTPGMRQFQIRLQNTDTSLLSIGQAFVRLGTSAFGLGNLMVVFDRREFLAFQDYWANCEVVVTTAATDH
ncbi:RDD family protein [Tolumonas lignilytica]|uniref:RDD family protein n=1 Tax=Tolumonas lignilytica TaxID=1283284 RepID=UPI0004AEEFA8|nr:RDD family protein [Tolumonas lignilytica]